MDKRELSSLKFSPDGSYLIAATNKKQYVYDTSQLFGSGPLSPYHFKYVSDTCDFCENRNRLIEDDIVISPDSNYIYEDGTIYKRNNSKKELIPGVPEWASILIFVLSGISIVAILYYLFNLYKRKKSLKGKN